MTKFNWNNPPIERDPARYKEEFDLEIIFSGMNDDSIHNKRKYIRDQIASIDNYIDHALKCIETYWYCYNDFDTFPSESFIKEKRNEIMSSKDVLGLLDQKRHLTDLLDATPRRDRF